MAHPKTHELIQYAERRVSERDRLSLQQQIETCATCALEIRKWEQILDALKGSDLQSAPAGVVGECVAIYQIPKPAPSRIEMFARLIFDSIAEPLTAGVRGSSESRQIVLRCENIDAHVRISNNPPVILGQLLQRTGRSFISGARIGLIYRGMQIETTITDRLGEFRFGIAPHGHLRLQAELPGERRFIADFTVSEKEGFVE